MATYHTNRRFLSVKMFPICIAVFVALCTSGCSTQVSFEDFTISMLQRHIHQSTHFPVCVILRNEGSSTKLESRLLKFWTAKDPKSNYSSWEIGRFSVDKVADPPVKLPELLPSLRCYLGFATPFDFKGKASVKSLQKWFKKLSEKHAEQLEEATPARVDEMVNRLGLTLIGFSGHQKHYEVEEMLLQVRDRWKEQLNVLFVHPHSPDVRILADRYKVRSYPSAVLVENSAATDQTPVTRRTFTPAQMTHQHLHLYLTARSFPAVKLTTSNFEDVVLELTKYYVPIVVCFYLETSQHALQHLYALQRAIESFRDNKIDMRFGLVEVNFDTRLIMEKWVKFGYTTKFPFTVVFHPQWQNGAVVDIQQTLLEERPTVLAVWQTLRSHGLPLKTKGGITVDFQPWGHADPNQVSQLFEGPYGLICSTNAHNETDNIPRSHPVRQTKKKRRSKTPKGQKKIKIGSWHQQFDSASIDSTLHRVGKLPVVTEDSWAGVIEKSHAPNHPFYPGNRWRGEFTKVALVIFIIADCGSCKRNMATFEELQTMVVNIEGSSLYLVNCTSDPRLCERNNVKGFPSVCAFRGLGWLRGDRCLSREASLHAAPVKMDYHGILQVVPIMEWFSGVAAAEAVKNVRFQPLSNDTMEEDVRLVGTLIPRSSRYLPRVSKAIVADYFYPYECLRVACEHLYGQAACYVQYSNDIPRSEFSNEDQDMIVSKVSLLRRDGLSATVVRLGRTLASVLEEEADSSIHVLHRPHRYDLPSDMKCETDHAACTDLVVQFAVDHARLPITHMSSASFHMSNTLVFQGELPVLVTLVHHDNITAESEFYATLQQVAHKLYNDIVVVTVDVDQYSAWSGQFVPRNYAAQVQVERAFPSLYVYPRFCIVNWTDHHHAAFYPPVTSPSSAYPFIEASITQFVKRVLVEPKWSMVETEHF